MSPRQRRAPGPKGAGDPHPEEAVVHIRQAIEGGTHWYLAVLEAMRSWTLSEETFRGRHYRYLVGGEAFDWTLLVRRLCDSLDGAVPEEEARDLFVRFRPPLELSSEQFARLLGPAKFSAYLNFWYGVVVEEALQAAVRQEVEKRHTGRPLPANLLLKETFLSIYEEERGTLFQAFLESTPSPGDGPLRAADPREFLYWLFKYRLAHGEPARVASDTRKALRKLQGLRQALGPGLAPPATSLPPSLAPPVDA